MKCPNCDGTGKVELDSGVFTWVSKCDQCGGSGIIDPQTNEEWFCSLSTEEKAKWLSRNSKFMYGCGRMETTPKVMYEEDWVWWLKQPHREE